MVLRDAIKPVFDAARTSILRVDLSLHPGLTEICIRYYLEALVGLEQISEVIGRILGGPRCSSRRIQGPSAVSSIRRLQHHDLVRISLVSTLRVSFRTNAAEVVDHDVFVIECYVCQLSIIAVGRVCSLQRLDLHIQRAEVREYSTLFVLVLLPR